VKNGEGKKLIDWVEENGWGVFNGGMKGDVEGEYTFTGGRGNSTIDFVMGEEETREEIDAVRIEDRIDSDHHPVVVEMKERKGRKMIKGKGKKEWRGIWDEEGRREFRKKWGEGEEMKERGIEEQWKELKEGIKRVLREVEEERKDESKAGKKAGWWDEECREEKKRVRKSLRRWRKGEGEEEKYKEGKKGYKELCERKKMEENLRWEREVERVRRENEVWEIVNRERRRRRGVNENIEMREWKEQFMRLLGGVEGKVVRGAGVCKEKGEEEPEIGREEMKRAIKRLREGKASGADGIPGEVWKHGGERLEEWAWEFCNRIWRGDGWPEEWKEEIIVPIVKKGRGEKVEEYRGVTLLSTLYKIYVMVLTERLNEEIEEKGIVPHNQTGFRRGMGTIDNIYVMNYLINRQLEKKGGRLVAFFVDLKAAFDSVDREVLIGAMREREVREGITKRVEQVLGETKSRVRVGENWGNVSGRLGG